MTGIKFENPLDYSVENIELITQSEVDTAISALDKHLDTVEKREAELLEELAVIEKAKQGDTGKVTTLAGISRAAKATVASNREQIKTELEMVRAFKLNEAVPLLANLATASSRMATEAYKLHFQYREYLSLQTIEAYDEISAYLRSIIWDLEQDYTEKLNRAGFKETNFSAPSGHSVLRELHLSKVPSFNYREAKEKLEEFVNMTTSR